MSKKNGKGNPRHHIDGEIVENELRRTQIKGAEQASNYQKLRWTRYSMRQGLKKWIHKLINWILGQVRETWYAGGHAD